MGATVVVQPLDLLKNRMQLSGEGGAARAHRTVFHAGVSVFKSQGVPGLYKGYVLEWNFNCLFSCFSLYITKSIS